MAMLSDRLKELRKELSNAKQMAAADEMGISRGALSSYESGKVVPRCDTLITMARYYRVSLDYLVGLSSVRNPASNALLASYETLYTLLGDTAPTSADATALVEAALLYQVSGAPCGEQVFAAWRDLIRSMTACFNAAARGDQAKLLDSANAATVCALEFTRMPANFNKAALNRGSSCKD